MHSSSSSSSSRLLVVGLAALMCISATCLSERRDDDKGFVIFPESGAILHQDPVKIPIIVVVNETGKEWASAFKEAVIEWNGLLGFPAFIYIGVTDTFIEPMAGIVPILLNPDVSYQGHTYYWADSKTGMISKCFIAMGVGEYPSRVAVIMAMHELGHVLGLAHDDTPTSIMVSHLSTTAVQVTEADLLRLQRFYGPPKLTFAIGTSTTTVNTSSTSTLAPALAKDETPPIR